MCLKLYICITIPFLNFMAFIEGYCTLVSFLSFFFFLQNPEVDQNLKKKMDHSQLFATTDTRRI